MLVAIQDMYDTGYIHVYRRYKLYQSVPCSDSHDYILSVSADWLDELGADRETMLALEAGSMVELDPRLRLIEPAEAPV
jgi:hypothetical protein